MVRMVRVFVVAAFLAVLSAGRPAAAYERGPVCRVATVVDEMRREIRATDYYARVDPQLVTEQSTPTPNLVRCQVCVLVAPYDMPQFGQQPIRRCVGHGFEVRILPGGFVVRNLS